MLGRLGRRHPKRHRPLRRLGFDRKGPPEGRPLQLPPPPHRLP